MTKRQRGTYHFTNSIPTLSSEQKSPYDLVLPLSLRCEDPTIVSSMIRDPATKITNPVNDGILYTAVARHTGISVFSDIGDIVSCIMYYVRYIIIFWN